jgi:hypothetical protein
MFSPENLSLFVLLGITIAFIGIMFSPLEVVVEEEASEDEVM